MKIKNNKKKVKRDRRHQRVRGKIFGTQKRPRLSIFRSNQHIYAQLIDDEKGITLASAFDGEIKESSKGKEAKIIRAGKVGQLIAKKATEQKIKEVVLDRGGFRYHGQVQALAEGARKEGLKF